MRRRQVVPVRAQSFERTMNHEATKPLSVTARARARECKEPSAPGEVPVQALSDGGSIPPTSTRIGLLFLQDSNPTFFSYIPEIVLCLKEEFAI